MKSNWVISVVSVLALLNASHLNITAAESDGASTNASATSQSSDAAGAWKELQKASTPLSPPGDWQLKRPSQEQVDQFHTVQGAHAADAAEKARDFYTRFPNDPKAADAHKKELDLLRIAVQLGNTNKSESLQALEAEKLKDPNLSDDERFNIRMQAVQRALREGGSKDKAGRTALVEKYGRELVKEFPKRDEGYQLLLYAAGMMEPKEGRAAAEEIAKSSASDEIKGSAKGMLKKLDAVGKPMDVSFTALDDREVSLAKLKGKVVLVDFWATWCGPCVAELPEVKETFDKLHPKGFEIVGISLDQNKEKLHDFVEKEQMAWPQYFDGKGWQNKFARAYGVNAIPSMWLLDKKGNVRDVDARGGLSEKVEKLLAED